MKGETKEQRFKRIAEKRVQIVLDSLRKLSQCANRRMYKWNDEQLSKIWDAKDFLEREPVRKLVEIAKSDITSKRWQRFIQ